MLLATLIALVVFLLVIWAEMKLTAAFGVPEPIRSVIQVIVLILAVLWLLQNFAPAFLRLR